MARLPLQLLPMLILLPMLVATGSGCGASMHAVHEGDIRFEHCMALDAERHVKPSIRRACWAEWTAFYTYGQTRDRVLHAQLRIRQLSSVSDSLAPPSRSRLAPSPHNAGPNNLGPASRPADDTPTAAGRCSESCDGEKLVCAGACEAKSCLDRCNSEHRICLRRCI